MSVNMSHIFASKHARAKTHDNNNTQTIFKFMIAGSVTKTEFKSFANNIQIIIHTQSV